MIFRPFDFCPENSPSKRNTLFTEIVEILCKGFDSVFSPYRSSLDLSHQLASVQIVSKRHRRVHFMLIAPNFDLKSPLYKQTHCLLEFYSFRGTIAAGFQDDGNESDLAAGFPPNEAPTRIKKQTIFLKVENHHRGMGVHLPPFGTVGGPTVSFVSYATQALLCNKIFKNKLIKKTEFLLLSCTITNLWSVVPKLVRTVAQIKIEILSYYPQ